MAKNKKRLIEKITTESKAPIAVKESFLRAYEAAHKKRRNPN